MFVDKLSLRIIISSAILTGVALITYLVLEILVLIQSISLGNVILVVFNSILLGIGLIYLILKTLTLSLNKTGAAKILLIITECFGNVFFGLNFISVILAFNKALISWICFSLIILFACSNIILVSTLSKNSLIHKLTAFCSVIQALLCILCLEILHLNLISTILFIIALVLFIISQGLKLRNSLIILETCATLLFIIFWSIAYLFL